MLKVGDTVMWSGCWGSDEPRPAVVEEIDVECRGGKDGRTVESVSWDLVNRENVVVSLDSGNWAYGNQIKRMP